jgi:hypothetical protein
MTTLINSVDQYPWGSLHNDAPVPGQPTVSLEVYKSVIPRKYHKEIQLLSDQTAMKKQVIQRYNQTINEIKDTAIEQAYTAIYNQVSAFRTRLDNSPKIHYYGAEGVRVTAILRSLADSEANGKDNSKSSEVTLDVTSWVSPYQTYNYQVDGMVFTNAIQYMYYQLLLVFSPNNAYSIATTSIDLATSFTEAQTNFIAVTVYASLKASIKQKLIPRYLGQLLHALPVPFVIEDTFSSLLQAPINKYTNHVYKAWKQQETRQFKRIMNYASRMSNDMIRKWVLRNRVYNLLVVSISIADYLRRPMDTTLLMNVLHLVYNTCPVFRRKDTIVLVREPPVEWIQWLRPILKKAKVTTGLSNRFAYFLWMYASVLLSHVRTPEQIDRYIQGVPVSFTKRQVYQAVRNIVGKLYQLRQTQLAPFTIGPAEYAVIQQILRVKKPIDPVDVINDEYIEVAQAKPLPTLRSIGDTPFPLNTRAGIVKIKVDRVLLDLIEAELIMDIPGTKASSLSRICNSLYSLVEHFYLNQYALTPTCRSMIYYHS